MKFISQVLTLCAATTAFSYSINRYEKREEYTGSNNFDSPFNQYNLTEIEFYDKCFGGDSKLFESYTVECDGVIGFYMGTTSYDKACNNKCPELGKQIKDKVSSCQGIPDDLKLFINAKTDSRISLYSVACEKDENDVPCINSVSQLSYGKGDLLQYAKDICHVKKCSNVYADLLKTSKALIDVTNNQKISSDEENTKQFLASYEEAKEYLTKNNCNVKLETDTEIQSPKKTKSKAKGTCIVKARKN